MKTQIKLMVTALVALAVTAVSCKKDNESPTPTKPAPAPTKTQLITAKSWKMTSMVSNGMEVISFLPACSRDNTVRFKTGGVATMDEGASKCKNTDPQTEDSPWKFLENDTKLVLEQDTGKVLLLTSDSLKMENRYVEDGDEVVSITTFVTVK